MYCLDGITCIKYSHQIIQAVFCIAVVSFVLSFFLGIQPPTASNTGQKATVAEQELYRR